MNSYFNDFTVFDRNISTTNSDSINTKIKSEIIWKEISVNFFGLTMPLLSFENISTTENNENDPIFVFTVNELTIFCEKNMKLITEEKFEKFTELEENNENLDENFVEITVCSLILKIKSVNLYFFNNSLEVDFLSQNRNENENENENKGISNFIARVSIIFFFLKISKLFSFSFSFRF